MLFSSSRSKLFCGGYCFPTSHLPLCVFLSSSSPSSPSSSQLCIFAFFPLLNKALRIRHMVYIPFTFTVPLSMGPCTTQEYCRHLEHMHKNLCPCHLQLNSFIWFLLQFPVNLRDRTQTDGQTMLAQYPSHCTMLLMVLMTLLPTYITFKDEHRQESNHYCPLNVLMM